MPDAIETLLQSKIDQLEVEVLMLDELFEMQKLTVDPTVVGQQLGIQKEWALLSLRAAKSAFTRYKARKKS